MTEAQPVKTATDALRHHPALLVGIVAAFLIGGVAWVNRTPTVYRAQAILLVDVRANEGALQQADGLLSRYYIQQANRPAVLSRVLTDLNLSGTTVDALSGRIEAEALKGTNLVVVRARASTATAAAALADGVANAVIAQNKADTAERLLQTRKYLNNELSRLDATIQQLSAAPASPAQQAQLDFYRGLYAGVYGRLQDVSVSQSRAEDAVGLFERATPPSRPIEPQPLRYLLASVLAGLTTAILVVLLVERLDDRIYSPEGLARASGAKWAVLLPSRSRARARSQTDPYALTQATVLAQYPQAHTILITGAGGRDRPDLVAAAWGASAASAGQRVLLVQVSAKPGDDAPQPINPNGSTLTTFPLSSGEVPGTAGRVLADARAQYDLTLISAPSPDASAAAVSLASKADLGMLVATARVTRFGQANQTAEALRLAGIQLAAGILVPRRAFKNREEPIPEG